MFHLARLFLLISGCLLATVLRAQDALRYHQKINQAELAICDSDLVKAEQYYAAAFAINPDKPFSRDLCNAFFAAMDSRQYQHAESYFGKLLSRGLGQVFLKEKILKYYKDEQQLLIKNWLIQYPNDTVHAGVLRKAIEEMTAKDQAVRKHFAVINNGAYMVDSVYAVDYAHALRLLSLFRQHGVPNEAVLGNDPLHGYTPSAPVMYYLLLMHHNGGATGGRPGHLLDTLLCRAVFSLDLSPHSFAWLLHSTPAAAGFSYGKLQLQLPFIIEGFYYNGLTYPEYRDVNAEQQMNVMRARIGLEPLDDLRKKIAAANHAKMTGSPLGKYLLNTAITVEDGTSTAAVNTWLAKYGKDGTAKRTLQNYKLPAKAEKLAIGALGDKYVIGTTTTTALLSDYARMNKEYYQGQVPYKHGYETSMPWNYHAELVAGSGTDTLSPADKRLRDELANGHRVFAEYGRNFWFGTFRNIELVFTADVLSEFRASVDTAFYKTMIRYAGAPGKIAVRNDTVQHPTLKALVPLTERTYTWTEANREVLIIITETLTDKGKKQTTARYLMNRTMPGNVKKL